MGNRRKRKQITGHLDSETKEWFSEYASSMHMADSEAIRLLIERERRVGWLRWALNQKDPEQNGESPPLTLQPETSDGDTKSGQTGNKKG